jgi:hypothetical protein
MKVGREEAFDLFRKWDTARSLLLCNLRFPLFAANFTGRVVKLTSIELRVVSDDTHSEFVMTFRPDMDFYYQDVRNTPTESHLYECGVAILFSGDIKKPAEERDHIGFTEVKEAERSK